MLRNRKTLLIAGTILAVILAIGIYYVTHRTIVVPKIHLIAEWEIKGPENDPNYMLYKASEIEWQSGYLYVCDAGNNRIMKYDENGNFVLQIGRAGQGPGELIHPAGLAVHPDGTLFVLDSGNARIQVFDSTGRYVASFRVSGKLGLTNDGISVDQSKRIFVPSDASSPSIVTIYSIGGKKIGEIGKKLTFSSADRPWQRNNEVCLCLDSSGDIYVLFFSHPLLRKYSLNGQLIWERNFSRLQEVRQVIEDLNREKENGEMGFALAIEALANGMIVIDAPQPYLITSESDIPKGNLRFFRSNGEDFIRKDIAGTTSGKLYVLDWEDHICRFKLP